MNRRNRLRRAALVLALLMLAAIVTGVAASATTTAIPEKLTGRWERNHGMRMVVSPRGAVEIDPVFSLDVHAELSHVTAHRLSISGGLRWCSGPGRYRWTITQGELPDSLSHGYVLRLSKIHDACGARAGRFTGTWERP